MGEILSMVRIFRVITCLRLGAVRKRTYYFSPGRVSPMRMAPDNVAYPLREHNLGPAPLLYSTMMKLRP